MEILSRGSLIVVSAILRLMLIVYGEWQDTHMEVHYTDIDYLVFSDAASLMVSNSSPYDRSTYRYSPLLALILIPNSYLHHCWGKLLFSAAGYVVCQRNSVRFVWLYGFSIHSHSLLLQGEIVNLLCVR